MTSERWKEVEALFEKAREVPADEQPQFLDTMEDDLRREVESLLSAHGRADGFLDKTNQFLAVDSLEADHFFPGQIIERYCIVREIGRGGMGVVFLAERADAQYEKQVAIKLIKRGTDTDSVLRQFRNERQILAGFDHPNIARLLDGGTTESGLPYFVMEYVEGLSIFEYCQTEALSVIQRLKLFREVCAAVSYAHRRLVIHRDLKRSNILITADGIPKLLDFGIAKILQQGDEPLTTLTGLRPMTPEYASPEQLRGEPMTTASDVYSLGVILYELLCGHSPYRFPTASPHEIAHVVSEVEPRKPSTAMAAEGNQPSSLGHPRTLRGDLDNIVLMALRKEPERRYQSVEQFSDDIRRHLDERPVLARKDTVKYRAAKFIRRNKTGLAAAALVFLLLVGGIIATGWQARIAMREKARAERRFNDVRKLANNVLFDYHDAIKDLHGATPVRERLVRDGLEYLDRLASDAKGHEALQRELASAYERVGDLQGGSTFANLGDTAGALSSYRKAIALREALGRKSAETFEARREIALVYGKLGLVIWEMGDIEGGLENNRKALALLSPLAAERPQEAELRLQLHKVLDNRGMILQEHGQGAEALDHYTRALAVLGSLPENEQDGERVRRAFSVTYEHIGTAHLESGELDQALEQNRKALAARAALWADFPLNADYRRTLLVSYYNNGEILAKMGRHPEALESYRKDLEIAEELSRADPKNNQYRDDLAYAFIRVGDMLERLSDSAQALTHYRRSLALRSEDVQADASNLWKRASLIEAHAKMTKALARAGEAEASRASSKEALALMENTTLEPTNAAIRGFFADTFVDLAEAHALLASPRESEGSSPSAAACEMYRRSLEILQDLRQRDLLSKADAAKPEAIAQKLSLCRASSTSGE